MAMQDTPEALGTRVFHITVGSAVLLAAVAWVWVML